MSDEILWFQKYRPKKIQDCILPDRLKTVFQKFVDLKEIPNLLLAGSSGVGKTTAAIAMCEEVGLSYMFINGSKERGIDTLRTKVQNYASTMSMVGGRKVIIIDEADSLTPETQLALRGVIEEFSSNVSFIFTCNFKAKLIDAIHSRCSVIEFNLESEEKPKMAGQLLKRLTQILDIEGIGYDKAVIAKIIEKHFPDYRRTINEIQKWSTFGDIDVSVLAQVGDIKKMSDLARFLKNKEFGKMRKWVANNSDIDVNKIYRRIFDSVYEMFKPEYIPQAVVILAKYQYQNAFCSDPELNLVACLTEIMVETELLDD